MDRTQLNPWDYAKGLDADAAHVDAEETFTAPKIFGPVGDGTAQRIIVYAEVTGQTDNLIEVWSGTDTGEGGQRQRTTYTNEKGELRIIAAAHNSVPTRIKAQPNQTANLTEWTNTSNTVLSYVDAAGRMRAPNIAVTLRLTKSGDMSPIAGTQRVYNDTGTTLTLRAVRVNLETAPLGADAIFDVNKNGTTIFTSQANRPTVAASALTSGKVTNMDVVTLADGDYLTIDCDQAGSGTAGADMTCTILAY